MQALGPVRLVRSGGAAGRRGFALALVAASPAAAVLGFACLGIGVSCIVPLVFRAAGHVPGSPPAWRSAPCRAWATPGSWPGPPLVGALAELTSLPTALWLLVGLAGLVAALAERGPGARRRAPAPSGRTASVVA